MIFIDDLYLLLMKLITSFIISFLKLRETTLFYIKRSIFNQIDNLKVYGNRINALQVYSTIFDVWAASRTGKIRFSQDF